MLEVKLLRLKQNDGSSFLLDKGFTIVKDCGIGSRALKLALGFGYIEALILTMNQELSNLIYIHSIINKVLANPSSFPNLCKIFNEIINKQAEHDNFVRESKNSTDFKTEIIRFVDLSFSLNQDDSDSTIIGKLPQVSQQLNLHFVFYSSSDQISQTKFNLNINAIRINILKIPAQDSSNYLLLYHKDYKDCSEASLSISHSICEESSEYTEIFNQEREIRELFKSITSNQSFELNKGEIISLLAPLKNISLLGLELEQLIQN